MKKLLLDFSPLIAALLIIAVASVLFLCVFGGGESITITASTLTEMVPTSKLMTVNYIYNGIAKSVDKDGDAVYIAYKSTVRLGVNFTDITYTIDEEAKTVKPVLPDTYEFEVELDDAETYIYPDDEDVDYKDIQKVCKKDARESAQSNQALMKIAEDNLKNSISALLEPILSANGYKIVFE